MGSAANACKVYAKVVDAETRLAQLGMVNGVATLREALAYGAAHAAGCTLHDPASLPGTLIWGKGNRRLRDLLVPQNWTVESPQNYPLTVHPSKSWCIAIAPGDYRTGTDEEPSTRSERGEMTVKVVSHNQASFSQLSTDFDWPRDASSRLTWLLLHFVDHEAEVLRAELSLPAGMTTDKFVVAWRERIILPPIDLTTLGQPMSGPSAIGPYDSYSDDEIEIAVSRKQ